MELYIFTFYLIICGTILNAHGKPFLFDNLFQPQPQYLPYNSFAAFQGQPAGTGYMLVQQPQYNPLGGFLNAFGGIVQGIANVAVGTISGFLGGVLGTFFPPAPVYQ